MNTVKCSNRLCEKEYSVEFDKCPFCGTPNPMEESERKAMIEKSKVTDIRNTSSDESLFNGWVTGIIWVNVIFFGARGIISSFTNMIFSPLIGCITLGLSIVGIISLLYILRAKKWAFFLWIAYRIAGAIVVSIINPKYSLTAHIIFAVVNILLMIAVLQIKKNGVSAWSVIFSKHKSSTRSKKAHHILKRRDDTHNSEPSKTETNASNEPTDSIKDDETQCALKENVLSTPIYAPSTNEVQEEIPSTIIPNEQPIERNVQNHSTEVKGKPSEQRCKKKTLKFNKWWLYLVIIVGVLAIALLAVWLSHRIGKPELGEYVYVDNSFILHSKRDCKNIAVYRGAKPVSILSLSELTFNDWKYVCSECVTDKIFEQLQEVQLGTENRLWLYNTLNENGYNLGENYYIFDSIFRNRDDSRKWCYEKLQKEGFIMPSYEEFISDVGLDSEKSITRTINYEKSNLRKLYDSLKSNGVVKKSYENFHDYLQVDNNKMTLYKALKADNWDVPDSYESFKRTLFELDTLSQDNSHNRKWLYYKMQAAGVETGSFEYFKYSLSNKEDLNWYYEKCQELGLDVGSYSEFVKQYAL